MVAEVGGDLAAETRADNVYGGGVDGKGRRGEQLDQSEGILAYKAGREAVSSPDILKSC